MSVLVFAEAANGKIRKTSLEAVNYAANIAQSLSTSVTAVIDGKTDAALLSELGKAGAAKVIPVNSAKLESEDCALWAAALEQVVQAENASVIIFSHDLMGKAIAPRLAVKLKAGIIAGAVTNPVVDGSKMTVTKTAYSGKATAHYTIHSEKKIITLLPNSFPVKPGEGTAVVAPMDVNLDNVKGVVTVKEKKTRSADTAPLPEAELVVSAGRGMKAPENWGIVEELAQSLGATTACSRPVADMHWRPHHEHVGQTGIAIRPNLYIAIGISGAIQHLAGVNGSKTIVVINTDKEAPFFKSADYGVIGDAFEVVPRLTAAIKKFKAAQH
ncbi:MAG TPA: electron transfer flavoprotein subunit alpha/FixB family protein [Bacteroidia bacterium]|nr:electron transfer flavoprotein subunit alpha/FixB family protein [Bacteroidia bacterium]